MAPDFGEKYAAHMLEKERKSGATRAPCVGAALGWDRNHGGRLVLDSEYFRKGLQADVDAMGGKAVVELHLSNGRSHRLRSVASIQQGYVTLEAYRNEGGESAAASWYEADRAGQPHQETERIVTAYEAIGSVCITSMRPAGAPTLGFTRTTDR